MTVSQIMKRDRCSYLQALDKADSEPPVVGSATCCAAWRERVKALGAEYARLQKLIDDSFKSEKEPNANAGERIPLVVKLFEVKHRADDIEALLEGKMPPDERRSKRGTQHNDEVSGVASADNNQSKAK